jgi:ubiquitin
MSAQAEDECDTTEVSLCKMTLSVRLCDYADCRKPLHTVLQCAKCKSVAYCSKDCQVCSPHIHTHIDTNTRKCLTVALPP